MRPSLRLLCAIGGLAVLGLLGSVWPAIGTLWLWAAFLFAAICAFDLATVLSLPGIGVERRLPGRFALGVDGEVSLTLRNRSRLPARIDVFDGIPPEAETTELPWSGSIGPRGFTEIEYPVRMAKRGVLQFSPTHLLLHSPLGLWRRRLLRGEEEAVRVYPNYEPVVRHALLAMEHMENQMGIVRHNRHGLSRDFHQLRDYHEGDVLSQIDWKATSRRLELISREYEEQRDQNIVLLIDSGRRMRALDGALPQFDHCLNAVLLLSWIALRQGDQVGMMSFGGEDRWLPPVKGQHSMTTVLNHLYDYQTTAQHSDLSEAAERLMARQRRRALVVVLTNLRSEDFEHLLPPLQMLRRRHLVLLASLREESVVKQLAVPVHTLDEALTHAATQLYFEDRQKVFDQLEAHGILSLDATASALPVGLANRYLQIKASGRL